MATMRLLILIAATVFTAGASMAPARATASLRTAASLEIRDALAVTLISDGPLSLILSTGVATLFSYASAPVGSGGSSGLIAGATGTGEVLSVSMGDQNLDGGAKRSEGMRPIKYVIAQFN